ncbi:T6SS immunity protein Tdi1 domain-containing protein [Escherichia coli]
MSKFKRFDLEYQDGKYLFELATRKCGQLNSDEIFGFEPALILGGRADISHVIKVNIQAHLTLLREFAQPTIYEL